jgi:DNA invertase Pin-like site-specific DNA recombinase
MGRLQGTYACTLPDRIPLDTLRRAGCPNDGIFLDTTPGICVPRLGLEACWQALASGDTSVVWRLDCLSRSMAHLVTLVEELLERQV